MIEWVIVRHGRDWRAAARSAYLNIRNLPISPLRK
jgi:hypothetical protein